MRTLRRLAMAILMFAGIMGGLDYRYPMVLPQASQLYARVVTDSEGRPLRTFADAQGVWRYPVQRKDVSPLYIEALLTYEDQWFWHHCGVNPVALLRAAWQAVRHGRVISGGSTLTMQVARLLYPAAGRSPWIKLQQILRALQLEWHLDKTAILELYLNLAPFGGTIEGVQAAAFAYLDKPASELTAAEAALLAVLPQAPSRLRPDRHPQPAQAARDKVLDRMAALGVWPKERVADAKLESVYASHLRPPLRAALLARRMISDSPRTPVIHTTLDGLLQQRIEDLLRQQSSWLPAQSSVAVLVVRNEDLSVQAYAGALEFGNTARFGYLDMVRGVRSPGSTLKPFLYAMALDDGLIHSMSLLADVPRHGQAYRPTNFSGSFNGPVSVTDALQRSLNVPAVNLLHAFGTGRFMARWQQAGLNLRTAGDPGLALILGGVGTSLETLVRAYSALANQGLVGELRFRAQDPLHWRYLLSPGSAWITADMLRTQPEFLRLNSRQATTSTPRIAWKTGTSYGFRDAWAIGVMPGHTVGVWVGRPDGTPLPGHYGALTAAPLMFQVFRLLPDDLSPWPAAPVQVEATDICWPLGTRAGHYSEFCEQRHAALTLTGTAPPTLAPDVTSGTNPLVLWVDAQSGKRVTPGCQGTHPVKREIALWPVAIEPWLQPSQRRQARIPPLDPRCHEDQPLNQTPPQILGIETGSRLTRTLDTQALPSISLRASGGTGHLDWYINGAFFAQSAANERLSYQSIREGRQEILVIDSQGQTDRKTVEVVP